MSHNGGKTVSFAEREEYSTIAEDRFYPDDEFGTGNGVITNNDDDDDEGSTTAADAGRPSPPSSALTQTAQQQLPRTSASNNTTYNNLPYSSSSGLTCPNCGSREIEQHDASGASVCTECGVVVEENAIVSSVEFVEGAGGASSMVGQFVSATSSKAYTGGGGGGGPGPGGIRGGRYGFSRDSRETTLANGRRRIQEVASRLRLGSHYVDAAHRLFTIAVEKNFVQGRRTTHVVAACLYIACRQEKSQHMLIDFSDALQVNVYTLGTCFLKFRRLLGLKLEIIDPALYVYRFAAHLNLDDKANAVALTALRLVGRMKRDWIVAGRRPAGICAAALLIAARAHGFSRHHQDVTRILRVCGLTVNTRVKEFEQTPSASLTLEQFNTVELESEADPPVFTRNKIREARAKAIQEHNIELLTSGALDDPLGGKRATKWRQPKKVNERKAKFHELYQNLEKELGQEEEPSSNDNNDTSKSNDDNQVSSTPNNKNNPNDKEETQIVLHTNAGALAPIAPSWEQAYPRSRFGKAITLPDHATAEERQASTIPVEAKLNFSEWKDNLPEDISDDLDGIFRTDEEVAQKEAIFNSLNKHYLEQEERKETARLNAEAANRDQEQDEAAQVEGHARYLKTTTQHNSRGKRRRRGGGAGDVAAAAVGENDVANMQEESTTEEALLTALSKRKISRKINYDAMSAIFDEDGSFSTDHMDDDAVSTSNDLDPVFAML